MPVLFDSSAKATLSVGPGVTSGSKALAHNVSALARSRVIAYVALLWTGEADSSAATFSATFGGVAMTQIAARSWDSNKGALRLFKLEDAPRGAQSAVGAFSGMPTEFLTGRNFMVISLTYSGVDTVGDPVTAGGTSGTADTVAVTSVRPAHRVLSVHGVGKLRTLTAYSQTKRQQATMLAAGALTVGDAPGAATVTAAATINATTANWGAIGIAMTPSVVQITASLSLQMLLRAAIATFRVAEPHPDREYHVPGVGTADPNVIAGNFNRTPDGVLMPIWTKDPDDTLEYTLHWDQHLVEDDEIVHVEHTTTGTLRVFSESFVGATTQVWLDGGTTTIAHPVRVRFTTRRGRRHDRTFYIAGVQN